MKKISMLMVMTVILFVSSYSQEKKRITRIDTKETLSKDESTDTTILKKTGPGNKEDLKGEWVLASEMSDLKTKQIESTTDKIIEEEKGATPLSVGDDAINNIISVEPKKAETTEELKKDFVAEKPGFQFMKGEEIINGFTGCNRFTSKYTVEGDKISFTNMETTTKDECKGEYTDAFFFQSLRRTISFRMNNGNIEFLRGEKVLMTFENLKAKK